MKLFKKIKWGKGIKKIGQGVSITTGLITNPIGTIAGMAMDGLSKGKGAVGKIAETIQDTNELGVKRYEARVAVLTSLTSGALVFLIVAFMAVRMFLIELGLYAPNFDAFETLNEFLMWILGALLGVSGTTGYKGFEKRRNSLKKEIEDIKEKTPRKQKKKVQKKKKHKFILFINRDYEKKRTLSVMTLKNEKNAIIWKGKGYELRRATKKGVQNVVGKTCIPPGTYEGYGEVDLPRGAFKKLKTIHETPFDKQPKDITQWFYKNRVAYIKDVPARSGIFIHCGSSKVRNADTLIGGCIMPFYELKGNRTLQTFEATRDLMNLLGDDEFLIDINTEGYKL